MTREVQRAASRVHWVDDLAGLARLAAHLPTVPAISLDTEQDSFFSYRTKVCLIQVGTAEGEWIVDPLRLRDLSALAGPLGNDRIAKILHAADNDVHLLRKDFGLEIRGLFDTMVAASVLGERKTGLAGLLEQHFGVQLEKRLQRSDWRIRPLSSEQVEYAALDVRHLEALMHVLRRRLEEVGRLEEAWSEFRRVERVVHEDRPFDPDEYLRIDGARRLDGVERRVLRELVVWRDELASAEDRAPFRICGNATLLRLAEIRPRDPDGLLSIGGLPERFRGRAAVPLIHRIRAAEDLGPLPPPPRRSHDGGNPRLDDAQRILFERLKAWRSRRAAERDVETGRVAPNALLLRLVLERPTTSEGLVECGLEPWRIREYGHELLAVLAEGS